jgi:hypothetical protein
LSRRRVIQGEFRGVTMWGRVRKEQGAQEIDLGRIRIERLPSGDKWC